jgi:hypothetical protein
MESQARVVYIVVTTHFNKLLGSCKVILVVRRAILTFFRPKSRVAFSLFWSVREICRAKVP